MHGTATSPNADVRARAILLHAIFPSLHPTVAEETASTTTSIAHGVRRAHRIIFPATTLGKDIDGAASAADIRRAHHDYIRFTVVQGTQVADVSHRREYQDTVGAWRVDTDSWDKEHARRSAKKLTSRFHESIPAPAALPSSPFQDHSAIPTAASSTTTDDSVDAPKPPLVSSGTDLHPAPVWLASVPLPPTVAPLRYTTMDDSANVRATEPVERYADVFDPSDHKGSLARELFLDGDKEFQQKWSAASTYLLNGISALATSGPLLSSTATEAGAELRLPTFGHCFLRHEDISIKTLQLLAEHTKLALVAPAPSAAADTHPATEAHEPDHQSPERQHHEQPVQRSLLSIKTKHVKLKMHPMTLIITPAGAAAKGQRNPKEDIIVVNVSVKNIKLKCIGDVLLAPSGRHVLVVEKADATIGSLSISTDRCGYNMILWALTPILKRILQSQIAENLVGRRQL